jgi:hypothetical protein
MKFIASIAALVAFTALLIAATRPPSEKEGSVFGITGVWKKDGAPLRFGNAVNLGDKICAERPGSLTVSFKDGTAVYSCERNGCPAAPLCVRGVAEEDKKPVGGFERIYNAVLPVIRRDGDGLISAVSDGTDVSEAVLPLKGPQVDLSPMLGDLEPGSYGARFKPLAPVEGPPAALVNFDYHEGTPTLVTVEKVAPGLYQVEFFDHEAKALGMDAWALVSGPETFGELSELFKQAVQISTNWSSSTDERSVRAFLRAYLKSLVPRPPGQ